MARTLDGQRVVGASARDIPDVSIARIVVRSASPVAGGSGHLEADAADNIVRISETSAG